VGLPRIVEELYKLASKGEPQFAPCALLQTMGTKQQTFYPEKGTSL
jgi:hypothetical protein